MVNKAIENSTTVTAVIRPAVTRKYLKAFFFLASSLFEKPVIRYQKVSASPMRMIIAFMNDPIAKRKAFMLSKIKIKYQ